MNKKRSEEWLSLSGVAEILGVHPSTARNWSDQGQIPVHRTHGGHRRYLRSEVELWLQSQNKESTLETDQVMQKAVSLIRMQIGEGRLEGQEWYRKLDGEAREQYRRSGQALFQGLVAYLASDNLKEGVAEARSLGYEYAARGFRHNLSEVETVDAFLFFHNALVDGVLSVYESAHITAPGPWSKMLRKINTFTDQVLLSLLETFQAYNGKEGLKR